MKAKTSSILAIASMFAFQNWESGGGKNQLSPDDIIIKPKKKIIPKGCKLYVIEEIEIIAMNEKSAIKKFKKYEKKDSLG